MNTFAKFVGFVVAFVAAVALSIAVALFFAWALSPITEMCLKNMPMLAQFNPTWRDAMMLNVLFVVAGLLNHNSGGKKD